MAFPGSTLVLAWLSLLAPLSAVAFLQQNNISLPGTYWNGTTTLTYSISGTLCQDTKKQTITLPNSYMSTFLTNGTDVATDDTTLTNTLEMSFQAYPSDDSNATLPAFQIATDSAVEGFTDVDDIRFWNVSVFNQTGGGYQINGKLYNDSGDTYKLLPSNVAYHSVLILSYNVSCQPPVPDTPPTWGLPVSDAGYFHLMAGSAFTTSILSNGSLAFEINNASLWCGDCAQGDVGPFNGSVHTNVGSVSVLFTSWDPPPGFGIMNDTNSTDGGSSAGGLTVDLPSRGITISVALLVLLGIVVL